MQDASLLVVGVLGAGGVGVWQLGGLCGSCSAGLGRGCVGGSRCRRAGRQGGQLLLELAALDVDGDHDELQAQDADVEGGQPPLAGGPLLADEVDHEPAVQVATRVVGGGRGRAGEVQEQVGEEGEEQQRQERLGVVGRAVDGGGVGHGGEEGAVQEGLDGEPEEGAAGAVVSVRLAEVEGKGRYSRW